MDLMRRLACAAAVATTLVVVGGVARAGVCEAFDELEPAESLAPVVAPAPAPEPIPERDRLGCWGNPYAGNASCWPDGPAGAPRPDAPAPSFWRDARLVASPALPRPEATRLGLAPAVVGAPHPGFPRDLERPPRRVS